MLINVDSRCLMAAKPAAHGSRKPYERFLPETAAASCASTCAPLSESFLATSEASGSWKQKAHSEPNRGCPRPSAQSLEKPCTIHCARALWAN